MLLLVICVVSFGEIIFRFNFPTELIICCNSQKYWSVSLNNQTDEHVSYYESLLTEDRRFIAILSHPCILLFAYLHSVFTCCKNILPFVGARRAGGDTYVG